ncbi:MAG TPA: hypothetical protein VFD58_31175 [Blastocatellia bacterium]|nr:hypothetical protein [Blastocatellia bacterium]
MKKSALALIACCLLISGVYPARPSPPQGGQESRREVLTNEKVIELAGLGFGDDVIIEKIRQSERHFDTSVEGLKKLRAARVSDRIIKEMLGPGTPPAPQSPKQTSGGAASVVTAAPLSQETKEGLRRSPRITIRGDVATVRAMLLKGVITEDGATLVRESPSQLVFRQTPKGMTGFLGQLYYSGRKPYVLSTITLSGLNGEVLVVVDTDVAITDEAGVEQRVRSANDDKKYRQTVRQGLAELKARVESLPPPAQSGAGTPAFANTPPDSMDAAVPAPVAVNEAIEFEVPPGRTVRGFAYANRRLSYQGRAFRLAAEPDPQTTPRFRISLLEARGLAAAIAVDTDGQSSGYVLDLRNYSVIGLPKEAAQKAWWSPSGRYVVFHCAYEGEAFVGVDLHARKVLRGDFPVARDRIWHLSGEPHWLEGQDVLALTMKEYCNPYDNPRCDEAQRPRLLAIREVRLDVAAFRYSVRR